MNSVLENEDRAYAEEVEKSRRGYIDGLKIGLALIGVGVGTLLASAMLTNFSPSLLPYVPGITLSFAGIMGGGLNALALFLNWHLS